MKTDKLLKLASEKPFTVPRFKKSGYILRKQCQRLCKNGQLEMVEKDHEQMYFRTKEYAVDYLPVIDALQE